MDILTKLASAEQWEAFYEYKATSGHLSQRQLQQLLEFIEQKRYLPVVQDIIQGKTFRPPKRKAISKMHSTKKRIVYTYDRDENQVLKLMTYLLLRKYDHLFSPNLYSFHAHRSAKDAIRDLIKTPALGSLWTYKADVSDYFNSINIDKMLPVLRQALTEEPVLYRFLSGLLTDPLVDDHGRLVPDTKGIMAGTPFSTFLANLYLAELDKAFFQKQIPYARYSDDIIFFAPSQNALQEGIAEIHSFLKSADLSINPDKEQITQPGMQWTFLGFSWQNGVIDIAPVSIDKLKGKMRRKTRALMRWQSRKGLHGPQAAKAFIKVFNRKLLEESEDHDLTWAKWYFPTITTADSLHIIDQYAQNCIRYLATGTHTKRRFDCRYQDMKDLGYVSLVHRYYSYGENIKETVDNPV